MTALLGAIEVGVRRAKCPNPACRRTLGETTVPIAEAGEFDVEPCNGECRAAMALQRAGQEANIQKAWAEEKFNGPVVYMSALPTRLGREGDSQPLPIVNDSPFIHELVMQDLRARMNIGKERYGTPLQANNGRNPLLDAYEELLDLLCYFKQRLVEEGAGEVRSTDTTPAAIRLRGDGTDGSWAGD